MKTIKQLRSEAKHLYRLCLVDGLLERGVGAGRGRAAGAGRGFFVGRVSTVALGIQEAPTPVVARACGTW